MNSQYKIDVVYEEGNDPVTGKWFPREKETLTIMAPTLEQARRNAPLVSKVPGCGRWMRIFHNGVELFGNF